MKKLIFGIGLVVAGFYARAQNGLENVVVEKYYVSNAADSSGSAGDLPVGSVTYRLYADMLPGYNFQALYGTGTHTLLISSSTAFFNNSDYGGTTPSISATNVRKNSALIDSYFSVGGAATGKAGVLKSEDTDGSPGNAQNILQNNDPSASGPINIGTTASLAANDGMIPGSPLAVTFVGINNTGNGDLGVFDGTSLVGGLFTTSNGSVAALGGATGPTAANRVLIGQFTTTGIFHFELNIQIGTPGGGVQNFVAANPTGAEITASFLTGTYGVPNIPPTVSITAPLNNATYLTGATVAISAAAADADGTVDSVQFYVDGVKTGTVTAGPVYNINWTAVVGSHILTAKAYDDNMAVTTSAPVVVIVGNVVPPSVSITSPANGSTFTLGNTVNIQATAADLDGNVDSVEFFVDGSKIGTDVSGPGPYTFSWPASVGVHSLTAKASDNDHATTTSAAVSITVFDSSSAYVLLTSQNPCANGGTFCLPLTAIVPVDNVIGYDVVLQYNKVKVAPTGVIVVSNDLVNPYYTSTINSIDTAGGLMNISVFFNGSAPANTEFNGTGEVFCVEFAKTLNFQPVDTAVFSISNLQESYYTGVLPKVVSPGNYITYQQTAYNSSLKFWLDNSPVKYDIGNPASYLITNIFGNDSSCSNQSLAAVQPDLNGNFSYDVTNGPAVNIQKDILGTTSVQPVVNGFDAYLTKRVLINDMTFIPSVYQAIAMDVNTDGVISAGDLSQINQRTVLIIGEYRQDWNYNGAGVSNGQPSKDWLFIDGNTLNSDPAYLISSTFPSNDGIGYSKAKVPQVPFCLPVPIYNQTTCRVIGADTYKGILLGDVNGNYATVVPNNLFRSGSTERLVFDLTRATVNGSYVDVPVSVWSSQPVNALDFAMNFNESNLSYNSILDHTNYMESLSNFSISDHILRFTSYSLKNYDLSVAPLSVRFIAKGGRINKSDLYTTEGFINGERAGVEIIGAGDASDASIAVYPNPANGILNVVSTEDARILLLDLNGKAVMSELSVNANQRREINTTDLAAGVYMLKIANDNFISMKKIVIKK